MNPKEQTPQWANQAAREIALRESKWFFEGTNELVAKWAPIIAKHAPQPTAPEGAPQAGGERYSPFDDPPEYHESMAGSHPYTAPASPAPAQGETPETDAAEFTHEEHSPSVLGDFARRLERERDEARRELADTKALFRDQAKHLHDERVAQLEALVGELKVAAGYVVNRLTETEAEYRGGRPALVAVNFAKMDNLRQAIALTPELALQRAQQRKTEGGR